MHFIFVFLNNLLNSAFGAPVAALQRAVGYHAPHASAPISMPFTMELLTAVVLVAFFVIVRLALSVEKPGPMQQLAEMTNEFVESQGEAIIGHGYEPHVAFVTIIFVFLLLCNCYGLLPGVETPTADAVVPLGFAIPTFLYYNYIGFRTQGIWGYFKEFMGPVWWLVPLMLPVEIISHLARNLSLTVRLYANMLASDLLVLVFFSMVPLVIPIVFLGLHLGVAVIQAYVFMLLALIYLANAMMQHEEAH
jgi:F-type H+-transporting ATPase subunit a